MRQLVKKYGYLLFMMVFSSLSQAASDCIIKQEFIFHDAPFDSCHAATITQTDSGALLCAWFGGTDEGAGDVAIWLSALTQEEWSYPKKIAAEKDMPSWNPVLFTMPSKEVILFYKVGRNPQQWSGLLKRSYDEGQSWTEAQMLPAGVIGPVKNKPLLLADGTLLCGSSIESWRLWGCWVDITSDAGHTWSKSTPINVNSQLFGIIQPTLFSTKDGRINLLARSHQIEHICAAESYDQGKTWSPAKPIDLPNPNSGIDAVHLIDGRVALVYNHSKEDRFPLNVAISNDEGKTWEMKLVLEETPGEYSYPSMIQTRDGKIHIVYTWNRKQIKHVVVDSSLL